MDKLTAFSNANAVFQYAHWRYSEEIISFVSNGVTYEVDIQLDHNNFDSRDELNCLQDLIATEADIKLHELPSATYDIITITYRFK